MPEAQRSPAKSAPDTRCAAAIQGRTPFRVVPCVHDRRQVRATSFAKAPVTVAKRSGFEFMAARKCAFAHGNASVRKGIAIDPIRSHRALVWQSVSGKL